VVPAATPGAAPGIRSAGILITSIDDGCSSVDDGCSSVDDPCSGIDHLDS
jgi:hypothetical protein